MTAGQLILTGVIALGGSAIAGVLVGGFMRHGSHTPTPRPHASWCATKLIPGLECDCPARGPGA